MVHLISLKMQGIRSVGNEPHTIDFLRPLTLIQGPNGTGKTTIIEALNYVTSGSLPSGKLATFVHDPKVANKTKIDGVVQLKFVDLKELETTATKRMTSAVSKTLAGVSVKSDESTLMTLVDGEMKSTSSKVGDFYIEVMNKLGVNKAVLDYVIFCHQEESNWPLSESKKLKERFDEIFEVSAYVEIMDQIKLERKALSKKVKDLDGEIQNHLAGYVNRSNDLHREIETGTKKHTENSEQLQKLLEYRKELEHKLSECRSKKEQLDKLQSTIGIKKATVAGKEENLGSLDVPDYNGNIEELQNELDVAIRANDYQQGAKQKETLNKEIAKIAVDLKSVHEQNAEIQAKINTLEVKKHRKRDIEQERDKLIADIKKDYGIEDDENIDDALERIKREKKDQRNQILQENKSKIEKLNKELDETNVNVATLDAAKRSKEADMSRLRIEIENIDKEIAQIGTSAERSSKLEQQIKKIEGELAEAEPLADIEKTLASNQITLASTKNEVDEFSKVIAAENDLIKKADELDSVLKKTEKLLSQLFSTPVQKNFSRQLTTLKMELEKKFSLADKDFFKHDLEMNAIMNKLNGLKLQNKFNDDTIKENQEQISQIGVEPNEVKEKLEHIRTELKDYRDQLGEKQGSQFLFKKWEEEIAKARHCPLCERACGSNADAQKLVTKVKKRHADLPSEIEELNESVEKYEMEERNLTQVLPLVDKIETLLNQTSAELQEIDEMEKQKATKEKDKETAYKNLEEARKKLDLVKTLLGDAKLLDKLVEDKNAAKTSLESTRESLTDFDKTKWDLSQFEDAKEKNEKEIESMEAEIKTMEEMVEKVRSKSKELHKLKEEKLKIGEKALQPAILTKSKKEKQMRLNECKEEIARVDDELPDSKQLQKRLRLDIEKANSSAESTKHEMDMDLNKCMQHMNSLKALLSRLDDTVFDENVQQNLLDKLNKLDERKSELERRRVQLETDKTNVSNKQQKVRILKDQLNKKLLHDDVSTLNGELIELQEQIDAFLNIEQETRKCQRSYDTCNNRIQGIKGEQGPLNESIQKAQRQLLESNIKNAVNDYSTSYLDRCLAEEMSKDLGIYLKCLDDAIIAFHTLKMERINKILVELWSTVYDGNDIEAIRIRSDAVGGNEKRKSYNYSVVMIVDGKELEMRDRCSAGQKVLASILIRIALAEVFATNCPILALDEPTTNLDTDKIDNIGHMLARLLQARDDRLQLIVITHDVQLVRLLHRSCRPEYVYGLSKNEYGVSQLKRHSNVGETQEIFS